MQGARVDKSAADHNERLSRGRPSESIPMRLKKEEIHHFESHSKWWKSTILSRIGIDSEPAASNTLATFYV
jgi:hypothetical protein